MAERPSVRVRPAPGKVVVFPGTGRRLPPEGALVPRSSYWVRRIREGSVSVIPHLGGDTMADPGTETSAAPARRRRKTPDEEEG